MSAFWYCSCRYPHVKVWYADEIDAAQSQIKILEQQIIYLRRQNTQEISSNHFHITIQSPVEFWKQCQELMKMTEFNPLAILEGTSDQEFRKSPALPVGDYIGVIAEFDRDKSFKSGNQKADPTKTWSAINVRIDIDLGQYPSAREAVNQDKVSLFDMVMLDLTPSGTLDYATGKNNRLRRYREALGQNVAGVPWAPTHMQGRPIKIKVKHEIYEGEPQARVDAVSAP